MGGLDGEHGQEMIQELESKLRESIGDKFREFKKDFIRMCKMKAKKHIDEKTADIRKGITAQAFDNLE